MKVYWTEPAEAHLRAIHAFLWSSSPRFADRMIDRITRRTMQIGEFPRSGRVLPPAAAIEVREVLEGPYRILYVVARDHVEILGVLHGSREGI